MSTLEFATFLINDTLCGMNILQIREVIDQPEFAPVPGAPSIVCGLMNLRGQIMTVVDTAKSLGISDGDVKKDRACIILKTNSELDNHSIEGQWVERVGNDAVGLIVDRMGEVIDVDESEINASPANTSQENAEYIKGVVKLDEKLMTILSLQKVLEL